MSEDRQSEFPHPFPAATTPPISSQTPEEAIWTCEICDMDETHCQCDEYFYSPPEELPHIPTSEKPNLEYPEDPPAVVPPASQTIITEPWICEICEQNQENCHCDDYYDLEDESLPLSQDFGSISLSQPMNEPVYTQASSRTVCPFYMAGQCRYGNNCRDLHPLTIYDPKDIDICPYFLKGYCKFGDNCNFRHLSQI